MSRHDGLTDQVSVGFHYGVRGSWFRNEKVEVQNTTNDLVGDSASHGKDIHAVGVQQKRTMGLALTNFGVGGMASVLVLVERVSHVSCP